MILKTTNYDKPLDFRLGDRICKGCGISFTPEFQRHVYCIKLCRGRAKYERTNYWMDNKFTDKRSNCDLGAAVELLVCADLLKVNLSVFRSVSSAGCFDLIAVRDDGKLWKLEVKRGILNKTDTKLKFGTSNKFYRWIELIDIIALGIPETNEVFYFLPGKTFYDVNDYVRFWEIETELGKADKSHNYVNSERPKGIAPRIISEIKNQTFIQTFKRI